MINKIAEICVLSLHLGFIIFVVAGGLLVLHRRWVAILHIPAAVWGIMLECYAWLCPLTIWEQYFNKAALYQGYGRGAVDYFLMAIIYPSGLTETIQILLAAFATLVNLSLYGWLFLRFRYKRKT